MRLIELNKIDDLTFLTQKLKAFIFLQLLLNEEKSHCSYKGFEETVDFADYHLLQLSADTVIEIMNLITDDNFTKN